MRDCARSSCTAESVLLPSPPLRMSSSFFSRQSMRLWMYSSFGRLRMLWSHPLTVSSSTSEGSQSFPRWSWSAAARSCFGGVGTDASRCGAPGCVDRAGRGRTGEAASSPAGSAAAAARCCSAYLLALAWALPPFGWTSHSPIGSALVGAPPSALRGGGGSGGDVVSLARSHSRVFAGGLRPHAEHRVVVAHVQAPQPQVQ